MVRDLRCRVRRASRSSGARERLVGAENMPACNHCYENDPLICPRAGDTSLICAFWPEDARASRTTTGDYAAGLRNSLAPAVRTLDALQIDAITGYTKPTNAEETLTAEEQAVAQDLSTLMEGNIDLSSVVARKRPALAQDVLDRLGALCR